MHGKTATTRRLLRRLLRIGAWLAAIILLIGLGVFLAESGLLPGLPSGGTTLAPVRGSGGAAGAQAIPTQQTTVPLRPATEGLGFVRAAGNLELADVRQVVVEINGVVETIHVNVGDVVEAGDLLLVLDSAEAEEAAQQALLNLASAQAELDSLLAGASPAEIAVAEANLRSAQERLADVMAGPTSQEIAAARASLAAAQAQYDDLLAPPSNQELIQLEATLRKAEVALAEAQTAYDRIAWQNHAGMTSEAAALQEATIDYESARAAYDAASAPASNGEIQAALSNIQSAQQTLNTLLAQPSAADIAAAEAEVASAEQALQDLLDGEDPSTLETARIALAQAQLDVEAAAADLARTELRAPISGTVLSVDLAVGQQASTGTIAFTLANTSNLQLTVNVAEMDVQYLTVGMPAKVAIDALPGQSFAGEVLRIAPASEPEQSVVNYPVTIQLVDENLAGVRAGMTAVAEMESASLANAWLAPRTAVQENNGQAQLAIIRNGNQITVPVTTGQLQGEWIVVESPELQEGDEVVATLATYVADDLDGFGPPGGGIRVRPGGAAAGARP